MTDRDELDTLRALKRWEDSPASPTVGATARDLADAEGLSIDEVQLDLDRYQHDDLVSLSLSPLHSAFYDINAEGYAELNARDGTPVPPTEADLDAVERLEFDMPEER